MPIMDIDIIEDEILLLFDFDACCPKEYSGSDLGEQVQTHDILNWPSEKSFSLDHQPIIFEVPDSRFPSSIAQSAHSEASSTGNLISRSAISITNDTSGLGSLISFYSYDTSEPSDRTVIGEDAEMEDLVSSTTRVLGANASMELASPEPFISEFQVEGLAYGMVPSVDLIASPSACTDFSASFSIDSDDIGSIQFDDTSELGGTAGINGNAESYDAMSTSAAEANAMNEADSGAAMHNLKEGAGTTNETTDTSTQGAVGTSRVSLESFYFAITDQDDRVCGLSSALLEVHKICSEAEAQRLREVKERKARAQQNEKTQASDVEDSQLPVREFTDDPKQKLPKCCRIRKWMKPLNLLCSLALHHEVGKQYQAELSEAEITQRTTELQEQQAVQKRNMQHGSKAKKTPTPSNPISSSSKREQKSCYKCNKRFRRTRPARRHINNCGIEYEDFVKVNRWKCLLNGCGETKNSDYMVIDHIRFTQKHKDDIRGLVLTKLRTFRTRNIPDAAKTFINDLLVLLTGTDRDFANQPTPEQHDFFNSIYTDESVVVELGRIFTIFFPEWKGTEGSPNMNSESTDP